MTDIRWERLEPAHEQALVRVARLLESNDEIDAALLQGSVARGDAHHGADIDLLVIVGDEVKSSFVHDCIGDVRVEQHRITLRHLRERLAERPGLAYGILESLTLFDRRGIVESLRAEAASVLSTFRVRGARRAELSYWLETGIDKANAALAANDLRRASFVVATASWPLVEALWTASARPVPPPGAVLARIVALPSLPHDFPTTLDRLLLGSAEERVLAFVSLATWVAAELRDL